MLTWDGSCITDLLQSEDVDWRVFDTQKNHYWLISRGETSVIARVKTSTTRHGCVIDELKPVFGLDKVGTHWAKIEGKFYLFYKCPVSGVLVAGKYTISVIEEYTLDEINYHPNLKQEVQKVFLFREILGISKNQPRTILLRRKRIGRTTLIQPIGTNEPNLNPAKQEKVISEAILEEWFPDEILDDAIIKFLGFEGKTFEEVNLGIVELSWKMEEVINRVDPDIIICRDEILRRIRARTLFKLNPIDPIESGEIDTVVSENVS